MTGSSESRPPNKGRKRVKRSRTEHWPLRRILCLFGRHTRSIGGIRRWGAGWRTVCRHCGCGLSRMDEGDKWQRIESLR